MIFLKIPPLFFPWANMSKRFLGVNETESVESRYRVLPLRPHPSGQNRCRIEFWWSANAPTVHQDRWWIAKFGRERKAWNTCRIEHATLRLAACCGIDVPDSKSLMVGNRDGFLIERFDRDAANIRRQCVSGRIFRPPHERAFLQGNSPQFEIDRCNRPIFIFLLPRPFSVF